MRSRANQIDFRNLRSIGFIFLLLIAWNPAGVAQEKDPPDVIKVNTDLVVFDVQVIDKKTKSPISDLTPADFEIADRGILQKITYFSHDELPLSIMLLLDVSGSVRPAIHRIRDGALEALGRLKPEDEVAVMAFASSAELVQDFTRNRDLIAKTIKMATAAETLGRATNFAPALDEAALKMFDTPQANRCVIIIVTDNLVLSWPIQEKKIFANLFDRGTTVYGLLVNSGVANAMGVGATRGMERYAAQTGGEVIRTNDNHIADQLAALIDRLRLRYALGYKPSDTAEDGKFRPVEIRLATRDSKQQTLVLTKRGYYFRRRSS
jgi:VWFA-related protein